MIFFVFVIEIYKIKCHIKCINIVPIFVYFFTFLCSYVLMNAEALQNQCPIMIFFTYSEYGRDFAKQLYMDLKASNYLLNDPNSSNIAEEELIATSIFETTEQDQLLRNNDDYLEQDTVKLLRDLLRGRIKVDDFCRIFSGALDVKNIQNSEGEWKSDHFLFEVI